MRRRYVDEHGQVYYDEDDYSGDNDHEDGRVLMELVLFGGLQVGYMTNPETNSRESYIEVNGEKVVCTAQGGECRYNNKYYSTGLRDAKSWRTPIIDRSCPNQCPFKNLVCDDHQHADEEKARTFIPYPEHNKFQGEFNSYCRCMSRLEKKGE